MILTYDFKLELTPELYEQWKEESITPGDAVASIGISVKGVQVQVNIGRDLTMEILPEIDRWNGVYFRDGSNWADVSQYTQKDGKKRIRLLSCGNDEGIEFEV